MIRTSLAVTRHRAMRLVSRLAHAKMDESALLDLERAGLLPDVRGGQVCGPYYVTAAAMAASLRRQGLRPASVMAMLRGLPALREKIEAAGVSDRVLASMEHGARWIGDEDRDGIPDTGLVCVLPAGRYAKDAAILARERE